MEDRRTYRRDQLKNLNSGILLLDALLVLLGTQVLQVISWYNLQRYHWYQVPAGLTSNLSDLDPLETEY